MQPTKITFFDIPTRTQPNSPNTWKVRFVLNYKGLTYETRFIPTAAIEAVCLSLNIPPTGTKPSGAFHYTLPALIDSTFSPSHPMIISESTSIIEYLEKTYPSPGRPLFPPGTRAFHSMVEHYIQTEIMARFPSLWIMGLYHSKLPDDQIHFRERMEHIYGKRLEEVESSGPAREKAWRGTEKSFDRLAKWIDSDPANDLYFSGENPTYPDFVLGGILVFLKSISGDEGWGRISSWNSGKWARFYRSLESCMAINEQRELSRL